MLKWTYLSDKLRVWSRNWIETGKGVNTKLAHDLPLTYQQQVQNYIGKDVCMADTAAVKIDLDMQEKPLITCWSPQSRGHLAIVTLRAM